ncbi:hypothetical protein [Pseudomonas sp. FP1742]|uniref:hypothetical protein n=1 Tax=Pseudomonas sp. FP1742 TaxID=2954079 RepID=UPI0027369BCA|nr:hypothetical protein [Pseudomonas sp. FP1742]WLG48623.1 hypothetical protein PSH64_17965 [Pseudomonas sp. FP1742]
MKISLIDNGLDSLKKGYKYLESYERLLGAGATDPERFSALKDSTLSIQHGIEILFKYSLRQRNELLLFNDITKLKTAFRNRREGLINELYEEDGAHTISFKETIERLIDICGLPINERFKKKLLKVESWRNGITHSAVLLNEMEVSNVLGGLLVDLDNFFGPVIGGEYLQGQGRVELDRAYRLTKAVHGELENKVKAQTVERLINALQANKLRNITAPGVFLINNPKVACSILQEIQDTEHGYGCDFINGHCSGKASIKDLGTDGRLTIFTEDNDTYYQFPLGSMLIYIPEINNSLSPLIFLYATGSKPIGTSPYIRDNGNYKVQHGVMYDDSRSVDWSKETRLQYYDDYNSDEPILMSHKEILHFLTAGPVCFLNVGKLDYGSAHRLLDDNNFADASRLYAEFQRYVESQE